MGSSVTITPDTAPNPQVTITPDAPQEKGFLSKVWDAVNKPVADFALPQGMKTKDIVQGIAFEKLFGETYIPGTNDFDTKAQEHFGHSPTKDAIKAFISGSAKDASGVAASLTSPLSIGTMAAGAATKIPGAAGTVAKTISGAASVGFAGKGVSDIAQAGTENTPEAWQQRLAGAANVAGGAAGAGATAKDLAVAPKTASELYTSALKPSVTLSAAERARRVQTGLQNEIPVSEAGIDKLNTLVQDLQNKVSGTIANKPAATVNKFAVASRLGGTAQKFANQVTPEADLQAIGEAGNEFLRNQPTDIPATQAQALKTGTYQQLKGAAYGSLKPATVEAQKALARGIKEELEAQFPEIKDMNAKEGALIGLDKSLERAVNRVQNWEEIGLGTPMAAGAMAAVTKSTPLGVAAGTMAAILRNPILKSKLAISLARKGVPLNAANARIASYQNALANAVPRGGQTSGQEGSE